MDNLVTSNIRQRPIRTLVSVAGVALGVALVMLFTGLARGMSNELQRRATNVRAELIFMRPGAVQLTATTANLDTRYVDRLKQIEGIEEALPVIRHFNQGNKGIGIEQIDGVNWDASVSYTHLRAHETPEHLVCRLLLEKKKKKIFNKHIASVTCTIYQKLKRTKSG